MKLPAFIQKLLQLELPRRREATGLPLQVAALPYRRAADGSIEILLVTSKGGGRWIVPKGWPMRGKTLAASAAQEAYEEAGVRGTMGKVEIGRFMHAKDRALLPPLACSVAVFPLEVAKELPVWPERDERERRWFPLAGGAEAVQSPQLAKLISGFSAAP